jgi:glutamine amidotransferase
MGWSPIALTSAHPLFETADQNSRYYFVHSYVACPAEDQYIVATAEHGQRFVAAIAIGNVTGVQFHPEKSHRYGKAVMRRFIEAKA